ncbi:MAG: hypothetical protein CMI85_02955 [Candidatus Pelagibacter sp.]|nr:hypothetical protein [Candidatus Pelagibacter sp.]|tara:strand:+ start:7117 stop:9063 length:1947 start_codon:yes stop_codon:yes gene_type:complete
MLLKKHINITLFSGGSGNVRFIELLKKIPNIKLSILVNGYDDGKSTGEIRKLLTGMLGPSDFRKNFLHLIERNKQNGNILFDIFNFRFPKKFTKREFKDFLYLNKNSLIVEKLKIYNLSVDKFNKIEEYFKTFYKFYTKFNTVKLSDISLGNILIASSYLLNNKNFNKSLKDIENFLDINHRVLNVTNGLNLYLNAILENGNIITGEADLVEKRHPSKISDLYLLKSKNLKLDKKLKNKNTLQKKNYLQKLHINPNINSELYNLIKKSDIIIYGPGTQHSSLFPSYMTKGLCDLVHNSRAKKFLITNIFFDNDILHENVESLINKFYYFFNNKKNKIKKNLVDYYLVNKFDKDDKNLLNKQNYLNYSSKINLQLLDWEKGAGLHYPNWLAKKIFHLSGNSHLINNLSKSVVSIIIPCLNEKRTIFKVLNDIRKLSFSDFNLVKEVIVVDGGSTDGCSKIIQKFKEYKFYQLNKVGRGEAINYGIRKSKGDVIVIYPSDDEYNVSDIEKVVQPIMMEQSKIVYGSRMIKCMNLDDQLDQIYKNNKLTMLLSKFGGKLINLLILAIFNKSISDPFTTVKAFNANLLKSIKLNRKGFDLDFEIFIKLTNQKNFFLEVPVNFKPRTKKQGKKITTLDGIKCLFYIIFNKFYL